MSHDNARSWRLGIDVGGTNTDAVVIDGELNLIAATKSPTTEDVMDGIKTAMHEVLTQIGHRQPETSATPCWAPRTAPTPSSSASA